MYCTNCGREMPDGAKFCPECGSSATGGGEAPTSTATALMVNKKSDGLAVILSFIIPGLGQLYLGKIDRGLAMLVGGIALGLLSLWLLFPAIAYIVVWIYSMYDAYQVSEEYNRYLLEHNGQPPW
ncbi:MAG: zinc-ribbon domain-containing protein [Thermoplasmata archaeon]|nr:zinc-ribbon domain-containing protein [Thermoplasmata archaeon]